MAFFIVTAVKTSNLTIDIAVLFYRFASWSHAIRIYEYINCDLQVNRNDQQGFGPLASFELLVRTCDSVKHRRRMSNVGSRLEYVRDQVSKPHTAISKIMFLHISILCFRQQI
jgi:hypothetical protein